MLILVKTEPSKNNVLTPKVLFFPYILYVHLERVDAGLEIYSHTSPKSRFCLNWELSCADTAVPDVQSSG